MYFSVKKLFKHSTIILSLSFCLGAFSAADGSTRPQTNKAELERIAKEAAQESAVMKAHPLYRQMKNAKSGPAANLNSDIDVELMGIDRYGRPVYYAVDNAGAAITTRANTLHPGGITGFNLSGEFTNYLAIWDGGTVLDTHQEFGDRVNRQDYSATHYHATHVAGTMIASGVQTNAKGMSYQANLDSYDWDDDDSEMASAAAQGIRISNHSYGRITGFRYNYDAGAWYWYGDPDVSETEDYGFGFYDFQSRNWDQIAYNAPYYTIMKSAGNDRGDGPSAGQSYYVNDGNGWEETIAPREQDGGVDGYDCVSWYGSAKNIITVGAVREVLNYNGPGDVVMSSFSGWGPVDDGRIKPDIVAKGVDLYSTMDDADDSYSSMSGTSMSCPNASGTMNLLYEYYYKSHAYATPLAATMKALVLHTADEAGANEGPDYKFGWGLFNAQRAAETIQKDSIDHISIQELTLENQGETEFLYLSDGIEPVRVTLVWTDVPGSASAPALNNRTPKLVNDLDLRVTHTGNNTTTMPYLLDPENPSAAAARGDNIVDNVEQVYIPDPQAGIYRISVTHKGTLAQAPQNYSIVIDGLIWADDPRRPVENLAHSIDYATGAVTLTWDLDTSSDDFENFRVFRDGERIGTSDENTFSDQLDAFGEYTYSVHAKWVQGESINNPEVKAYWTEPVAPANFAFDMTDEATAQGVFTWDHFRSSEMRFDDDEPEIPMTFSAATPSGTTIALRYTATVEGSVQTMRASVRGTDASPLGQVSMSLYQAGETDAAPGDLLFRAEPVTPEENGWVEFSVAEEVPTVFTEGQDFWIGFEWVETGHTQLWGDNTEPGNRGYITMDGSTWTPLSEFISGFYHLNPLIRVAIGVEEAVGEKGLDGYTLLRGTEEVATVTERSVTETIPAGSHDYKIVANYAQGTAESVVLTIDGDTAAPEDAMPLSFSIGQAYPNPFNPSVSVPVTLAKASEIRVQIYDILGRLVTELQSGAKSAGTHTLSWQADGQASGVYFMKIQAGPETAVRKVMLMR